MKQWNINDPGVSKITPDPQKAKALLNLIKLREKNIATMTEDMTSLIVEAYYEIVKELITGLLSVEGYKTLSHEMLIAYLVHYAEFSHGDMVLLDQLRKIRNDIAYRGVIMQPDYLERNKQDLLQNITKLKMILERKIK